MPINPSKAAAQAKAEARREYMRLYWHKRTKAPTKKAKLYKAQKAESKAAWQAANPEKNVEAVQRYRERWGRYGPSLAAEAASSAAVVSPLVVIPSQRKAPRSRAAKRAA